MKFIFTQKDLISQKFTMKEFYEILFENFIKEDFLIKFIKEKTIILKFNFINYIGK